MARKKTVKQENVTLASEEQENSVADITGTLIESPTKQNSPTLGQAQSLALRETEEEKPKPMAQEQPKELATIAEKQVFECMSFLNKNRLKPVFTNYGKKASCIIVDNDGNNVLPKNQITGHPMIVYGDDKDRALINAVNALQTHAGITATEIPKSSPKDFNPWKGEMPKNNAEAYGISLPKEDEYGHPFEDVKSFKPKDLHIYNPDDFAHTPEPVSKAATDLICALRNFIEITMKDKVKDSQDLVDALQLEYRLKALTGSNSDAIYRISELEQWQRDSKREMASLDFRIKQIDRLINRFGDEPNE